MQRRAVHRRRGRRAGAAAVAAALVLVALAALPPAGGVRALPSFARQTGLSCNTCHIVFPELTPFGRDFKLRGYTMISGTQGQTSHLEEGAFPPVSAMMQASYTVLKEKVPGTQNGNALLPDELSLFYAGRVSHELGAFLQVTYDGEDDHFTMDNADVRFAETKTAHAHPLVYGLLMNNNPTVSDPWNSTPAWGFPYARAELAPAPTAAAQVDGVLAQRVAGLGACVSWRNLVYAEGDVYRTFAIGDVEPPAIDVGNLIAGVTPYWRLALYGQNGSRSWEAGTYGLRSRQHPAGDAATTRTDEFLDLALDGQFQWIAEKHQVSVHATWIHERRDWDASFPLGAVSRERDTLRTFRVDASWYFRRMLGVSVARFSTTGDRDALLHPAAPVEGSATGSPDSDGWILEGAWVPWYNTRLAVQYTRYTKFNGGRRDYDGFGRDASDNDTLYFNIWIMF